MKRYLKELEDIRSQRDKNRYEIINRETVHKLSKRTK